MFPFLLAGYAVAAIGTDLAWRSGSYTSPLTHSRCSKTASFRATATAARFFAFFPPRSHSQNACFQPASDQADQTRVSYSMFDKAEHPFVA